MSTLRPLSPSDQLAGVPGVVLFGFATDRFAAILDHARSGPSA